MKEIHLTRGMVALVDDEDYDYINQWKWHVNVSGRNFYAARNVKSIGGGQIAIYMHRQIMSECFGIVDHRDRNTLNNQKGNLRSTNYSNNNANRSSHAGSTSKYIGVSWLKNSNKWIAQIQKNGRVFKLGRYHNEEIAAIAYNKAAMRLHGEFANINKVNLYETA